MVKPCKHVKAVLTKRLETFDAHIPPQYQPPKRAIQDLADLETEARQLRIEQEKQAAETKRRAKLQAMIGQENKMWVEVNDNLSLKTGGGYDKAVKLLIDLKELAAFTNSTAIFRAKLDIIKTEYGRSATLMSRFTKAQLS